MVSVLRLSTEGYTVTQANDIIKDPYVLEFVGLDDKAAYSETDLEKRLLDNLQQFLLELGKGFTFVARQKRFSFEEDHFKVDLVLIGVLLCNEKSDAMVELTFPKDSNIYASQYKLYLPNKEELQKKLEEWIAEME